ncbi:MAG: hypothetical protein SPJ13_00350 [Bacteroidales bacterium]|nr:hypothetical protein [Bacteroidales bacterium]
MKESNFTRAMDILSRWIVGLVFIFSSFVKGVDPLGTSYKIQEYMTAWSVGSMGLEWALPMATFLSMTLICLEFLVGVLMLTGAWRKPGATLLLLLMTFFTVTTLIDALTNKVTDCGCFGDAIKLTNWQTFGKNVLLCIPTTFIFLCRNWPRKKHFERDSLIAVVAVVAMVLFGTYNIKNEPVIDFRPWKVGNQMIPFGDNLKVQSFVTYKDKATGEVKELISTDVPYADSAWMAAHEFVDSRVVDPYEIKADGFSMLGPDGEDYARDIVGSGDYTVIATIHHLEDIDDSGIRALRTTHNYCMENEINMVLLSSALSEDVEAFLYENNLSDMAYYFADATAIKTMLRSNPGFVLLKDAKVLGKWSLSNARGLQDYPFEIE